MRFDDPTYLYFLAIVPIFIIVHYATDLIRRKRLRRFGNPELIAASGDKPSSIRREIKFWLLVCALTAVIMMIARPQLIGATQQQTDKRQGIEMMVCLDVSNSMLAQDVAPSRMEKCKMMLETLIDKFSDDKFGLVIFAGDAYVQLPLTADGVSAKMFLSDVSPGMVQSQGTDVSRAIDIAANSFSQQKNIGKAIVVITDGEDHEGGATDAAKSATGKGIHTYVLGVGSTRGTPIPIGQGNYLTSDGETVMTKLNEAMCKEIAVAGKGKYIHVDNTNIAQQRLENAMSNLARLDIETSQYAEHSEQFQAFALIALILLIVEIIIQEKRVMLRNLRIKGLHTLGNRSTKAMILLLFLLAVTTAGAQNDRDYIRRGNRQYRSGKFDKAEVNYRKALDKNKNNPQANYNLGNALLFQGKDSLAIEQYNKALETETDPKRQAMIYHNIGVVCQASKDFRQAIDAYKQSLRRNPDDNETRYNLVLCQKQLKNDDKNPSGGSGQSKNNNQDKDNNQKNDKNKNKDKDKDKNNSKDSKQDRDKNQQPPQPKNGEMSKENAEQLLNAAMQQEKETQEKLKKVRGSSRKLQKNW